MSDTPPYNPRVSIKQHKETQGDMAPEFINQRDQFLRDADATKYKIQEQERTKRFLLEREKEQKAKHEEPIPENTSKSLSAFISNARSVLWRDAKYPDTDHKLYDQWTAKIRELENNSNYTHSQAVVSASKEFPILHRLFREFDIYEFDPYPESHSDIIHYGKKPLTEQKMKIEGVEKSHRENLNWALSAAGEYLRTNEDPKSCPNDAAFYLYMQAKADPKDFLARFNQVEAKVDDSRGTAKQASQRSADEIDLMLKALDEEE